MNTHTNKQAKKYQHTHSLTYKHTCTQANKMKPFLTNTENRI